MTVVAVAPEVTPAAAAPTPGQTTPIPLKDFDLRDHMRKLLPSPAPAETKAPEAKPEVPAEKPDGWVEAKEEAPAEAPPEKPDQITRRMAALDRKQREHDAATKALAAKEAELKPFMEAPANFTKDPIAFMRSAGMSEEAIGEAVVRAVELMRGNAAPPAEPEAKPEPVAEEPAGLERTEAAKALPAFVGEFGADADLIAGAAADGLLLDGKDVYLHIVDEVEREYQAAIAAGRIKGTPTKAQAKALLRKVAREVNEGLAEDAELVAKHRKPAPAPAASKDESETPAALTSAMSGAEQVRPLYKSEAEVRAAHQARLAAMPRNKQTRRF